MDKKIKFLFDQYDFNEMDSETINQILQFISDQYDCDIDLEKNLIEVSKKYLYTLKEISNLKNGL